MKVDLNTVVPNSFSLSCCCLGFILCCLSLPTEHDVPLNCSIDMLLAWQGIIVGFGGGCGVARYGWFWQWSRRGESNP